MNWEKFQTAYQAATPKIKALIDSEEISNLVEAFVVSKKIPSELKSTLIVTISDVCLGILSKDKLGSGLIDIGIPFETSHAIYTDILKLIEQKDASSETENDKNAVKNQKEIGVSSIDYKSEASDKNKDSYSLPNLRTMAGDMGADSGRLAAVGGPATAGALPHIPAQTKVYLSPSQSELLQHRDTSPFPPQPHLSTPPLPTQNYPATPISAPPSSQTIPPPPPRWDSETE